MMHAAADWRIATKNNESHSSIPSQAAMMFPLCRNGIRHGMARHANGFVYKWIGMSSKYIYIYMEKCLEYELNKNAHFDESKTTQTLFPIG